MVDILLQCLYISGLCHLLYIILRNLPFKYDALMIYRNCHTYNVEIRKKAMI